MTRVRSRPGRSRICALPSFLGTQRAGRLGRLDLGAGHVAEPIQDGVPAREQDAAFGGGVVARLALAAEHLQAEVSGLDRQDVDESRRRLAPQLPVPECVEREPCRPVEHLARDLAQALAGRGGEVETASSMAERNSFAFVMPARRRAETSILRRVLAMPRRLSPGRETASTQGPQKRCPFGSVFWDEDLSPRYFLFQNRGCGFEKRISNLDAVRTLAPGGLRVARFGAAPEPAPGRPPGPAGACGPTSVRRASDSGAQGKAQGARDRLTPILLRSPPDS